MSGRISDKARPLGPKIEGRDVEDKGHHDHRLCHHQLAASCELTLSSVCVCRPLITQWRAQNTGSPAGQRRATWAT